MSINKMFIKKRKENESIYIINDIKSLLFKKL